MKTRTVTRRVQARRVGTNRRLQPNSTLVGGLTGVAIILLVFGAGYVIKHYDLSGHLLVPIAMPVTIITEAVTPTLTPMPAVTPEPTKTIKPTPTIVHVYGTVLAQVWLYDAPNGQRLPAGLLAGQRVEVLAERDGFYQVSMTTDAAQLTGWVKTQWIEVQQ